MSIYTPPPKKKKNMTDQEKARMWVTVFLKGTMIQIVIAQIIHISVHDWLIQCVRDLTHSWLPLSVTVGVSWKGKKNLYK